MSDTRLRDFERRWKETGTVEDEAAYLQERLRVGDLSWNRVQLGALLGHATIVRALHLPALHPPAGPLALAQTLSSWGAGPLVIALAAVAEHGLEPFEQRYPGDRRPWTALTAAVDWAWCPCDEHAQRARSAASEASRSLEQCLVDLEFLAAAAMRGTVVVAELAAMTTPGPLHKLELNPLGSAASILSHGEPGVAVSAVFRWILAQPAGPEAESEPSPINWRRATGPDRVHTTDAPRAPS